MLSIRGLVLWCTLAGACVATGCAGGGGPLTPGGALGGRALSDQLAAQPAATVAPPTAPPQAPGHPDPRPSQPRLGTSRPGQIYSEYIVAPTGDTVAFTVFEPATLKGGATYPLVLHGPGFGSSRTTTLSTSSSATSPLTGSANTGGNIPPLVAANYGVISIDQRGMGETTGKIRVMDPDYEGKDDLAVLNWAQAKLPWLKYAPTVEGNDPHEPVVGSIGGSYGGMYQYMLLDIDARHRLRAIVPQIAPSDLNFSLFQNGVIKAEWDTILFGLGTQAGTGINRANFDPFVTDTLVSDFANNAEDQYAHDFFGYHSDSYFCNGAPIATNGGAGTSPQHPPTAPPKIDAMIWIGVRDTLFNFNNGYANAACLARGGGDVRLLSYQAGHNSANIILDPGLAFLPSNDNQNTACGHLTEDEATLEFFDEHLKGVTGAANRIPKTCISLAAGDGITVPRITTGTNGSAYDIGTVMTIAGAQVDVPSVKPLWGVTAAQGNVVAGIPHARIAVSPIGGIAAGEPIVFVGLGQMHASHPGVWDLIDNQVTPLRGVGIHDVDLIGGGTRLQPGDRIALLVYGGQDQYVYSGSVNAAKPAVVPVTLTGRVWVPLLGPIASNV